MCLGLSLGLHGLVLRAPMPPSPPPQLEDPAPPPPPEISVTVLPKPVPVEPPAPPPEPVSDPIPEPTPPPIAEPEAPVVPLPAAELAPILPESELPPEPIAPEPELPPVPETPPTPYADFPHSDVSIGCDNQDACWFNPDRSFRSEARDLTAQLEGQGYEVENITEDVLDVDTGIRIYAVIKAEQTEYYLNLVSLISGGTIYTLTEAPITQEEFEALQLHG